MKLRFTKLSEDKGAWQAIPFNAYHLNGHLWWDLQNFLRDLDAQFPLKLMRIGRIQIPFAALKMSTSLSVFVIMLYVERMFPTSPVFVRFSIMLQELAQNLVRSTTTAVTCFEFGQRC